MTYFVGLALPAIAPSPALFALAIVALAAGNLWITAVALVAILLGVSRALLPPSADAQPQGPLLARPSRALVALGLAAFFADDGRLSADPLAERFGAGRGRRCGGLVAAAGLALALAAVSTTGYAGFIVGPALIGLLSDATSLPAALSVVVVLSFAISVLGGANASRPKQAATTPG